MSLENPDHCRWLFLLIPLFELYYTFLPYTFSNTFKKWLVKQFTLRSSGVNISSLKIYCYTIKIASQFSPTGNHHHGKILNYISEKVFCPKTQITGSEEKRSRFKPTPVSNCLSYLDCFPPLTSELSSSFLFQHGHNHKISENVEKGIGFFLSNDYKKLSWYYNFVPNYYTGKTKPILDKNPNIQK